MTGCGVINKTNINTVET